MLKATQKYFYLVAANLVLTLNAKIAKFVLKRTKTKCTKKKWVFPFDNDLLKFAK